MKNYGLLSHDKGDVRNQDHRGPSRIKPVLYTSILRLVFFLYIRGILSLCRERERERGIKITIQRTVQKRIPQGGIKKKKKRKKGKRNKEEEAKQNQMVGRVENVSCLSISPRNPPIALRTVFGERKLGRKIQIGGGYRVALSFTTSMRL